MLSNSLIEQAVNINTHPDILRHCSKILNIIANHPKAPLNAWIERYVVAQNPSTPAHVISQLAVDANRLVRAVAVERLKTF